MNPIHTDIGRKRQRDIYAAGAAGQRPVVPVAWPKLEAAAQAAMSNEAWAYVAGGAARESTMQANRAAFERWRIVPRVLRDVEKRDLAIELFGRKLPDGSIAALDALPAVAEAVGGKIPVLLDSGIRGGADIFKALALGASAVCLGRPYGYGLAVAGQRGVVEVIGNVLAEVDLTLGLAGCTSVCEIGRDAIVAG